MLVVYSKIYPRCEGHSSYPAKVNRHLPSSVAIEKMLEARYQFTDIDAKASIYTVKKKSVVNAPVFSSIKLHR